jgi:hypothetical protein
MTPTPAAHAPPAAASVRSAARTSWVLFLVCLLGYSPLVRLVGRFLADWLVMLTVLTGIGFALSALWRMRVAGRRGVLVPALVGLVLHLLAVAIFLSNVLAHTAS